MRRRWALAPFTACAVVVVALGAAAPATAQTQAFRCSDFTTQEEAQAVLQGNPALRTALDPDGNGIACDRTTAATTATTAARTTRVTARPAVRPSVRTVSAPARARAATSRQALARTGPDIAPVGYAAVLTALGALALVVANRRDPAGPWDILPRRRLTSLLR